MGNFSVSHYTRLEASAKGVEVTYVLDLAEVPTYTLLRDWKLDAKSPDVALQQKAAEQAHLWAHGLEFHSAGKTVEPKFLRASIHISEGSGGLSAARIASVFELAGVKPPLTFEDHNFPDRFGWKEIVIGSGSGAELVSVSQGSVDRSQALTEYPANPAATAPQDLRAALEWRVTGAPVSQSAPKIAVIDQPPPIPAPATPPQATAEAPRPSATPVKNDFLSRLLAKDKIGWQWMLLGLAVAFGIGGAHALEPGHGKTLVAAYLVGSRGTMKHAAILGGVVTFTHTISVFLLGLAMLLLSTSVVPDKVIRILEAVSGMSIVVIGAVMLVQRLRHLRSAGHSHHPPHHHHSHDHAHDHHHDHSHAHAHAHDHDHPHTGHAHPHEHGPHGHSHVPEGDVTLGSLIALGVSGGLVPCPAALVIMLAAIAFGHVGAGLILLVAFSLGLAGVLMAAGMMVLYAKSWLPDPAASSRHPLFRLVPVLSAIVILCLGLLMTGVSLGLVGPGLAV